MSKNEIHFAPSLLSAHQANLGKALQLVEQCGLDCLHVDIMDGHFVPNLSFGTQCVKDLRPQTNLFFDVHLMVTHPQHFLKTFAQYGANMLTVHVEIEPQFLTESLQTIKALGLPAGLALNPGTPTEVLIPHLPFIDWILVMSVHPGFGGQSFLPQSIEKIRWLAEHQKNYRYHIAVDGGINIENAKSCFDAGAQRLVMGSAFFKHPQPKQFISTLTKALKDE